MNSSPPPPDTWEVPVLNVLTNRPEKLLVEASVGRVVLVPPLGPGVTVPRESLQVLRDALNVAEAVADLQAAALRSDHDRRGRP